MSEVRADDMGPWLAPEQLEFVRRKVPMVYVDMVPVLLEPDGALSKVGLLLRNPREGGLWRTVVSGRVLLGETIRTAISRHIEKDLGPMALPRIPASPQPFTVNEYFPVPRTGSGVSYHDPRQHAVSLAYIVPIDGDARAQEDALQLIWLSPSEALDPVIQGDMISGHGPLVRAAISHLGGI